MKKIAVLMLAHKNYVQVDLLINQFDIEKYDIFIHLDKKSATYKSNKPNVFILSEKLRIDVKWGEFSMVSAMLNLLKESHSDKYSHYWFVSGQDLLLKDSKLIYQELIKDDYNYLNFMDEKYTKKFQYRNMINFNKFFRKQNLFSKIIRNIVYKFLNFISRFKKTNFVYGSQWQILSNEFVIYLLNEKILFNLIKFFKNKAIPDESFFQTAIKNSPYKEKVREHLIYLYFSEGSNNPKTFTISDYDNIISSNKYIARKFDLNIDEEIIKKILK